MANNRIGCSNNKTTLVDPNLFEGQSSSNNISVPLEDLNIWVQLDTYKKGRTVLTAESKKGSNSTQTNSNISIKFIEGTEINGEKVLTTKYTDLTTTFDKNDNGGENLGITAIDIDFNSSYAPLITIHFIDVRGSAIFQNEANITSGFNKYSTFFQLPYPLYELTIKGYYGMPVKYCLHMTKFNSKFNSQTGNFEITANFVGYTYAMLSDMLIGYLKAISQTEKGKAKYEKINKNRENKILTLSELIIDISKINEEIDKISSDDDVLIQKNLSNEKNQLLENIKNEIIVLGRTIEKNNLDEYQYIIEPESESENTDVITTFETRLRELINDFNKNSEGVSLDVEDYIPVPFIYNLTLKGLDLTNVEDNEEILTAISVSTSLQGSSDSVIENKIDSIKEHISKHDFQPEPTIKFGLYDLTQLYSDIESSKISIDNSINQSNIDLSNKLKNIVSDKIGFSSTIRNIVEIFTTAVEVFLETIHEVSIEAEENENRNKILGDKFNSVGKKIYPWPEYIEKTPNKKNVEKYLGTSSLGLNPLTIPELKFIDDLLNAFIKEKVNEDNAQIALINDESNWIPINITDTRFFQSKSPYKRLSNPNRKDVIRLIVIRCMTFLGYTNSEDILSSIDIENMARAEVSLILNDIEDQITKDSLRTLTLNDFIIISGKINNVDTNVIDLKGENYYYDYILDTSTQRIIPISEKFTGNWSSNYLDQIEYNKNGNVFLTNYSGSLSPDANNFLKRHNKEDDGGIYIKILPVNKFNDKNYKKSKLSVDINTENIFELTSLKSEIINNGTPGFNPFGSVNYGIQEFVNLDYGESDLENLPLRFIFYYDNNTNGLAINTLEQIKDRENLIYCLSKDKIDCFRTGIENISIINGFDESLRLTNISYENTQIPLNSNSNNFRNVMASFGKNRVLFNKYLKSNRTITYPFINYRIFNETGELFSLFGSRWYYEQTSNYSKALLFLSTLPWNGNGLRNIEIERLFNKSGGFIHTPLVWCAYIGGLLWRYDKTLPIKDASGNQIDGGSGIDDPIIWFTKSDVPLAPGHNEFNNINLPLRSQYFERHTKGAINSSPYDSMSELAALPYQVKYEFKQIFFDFVNGTNLYNSTRKSWNDIKDKSEIISGGGFIFQEKINEIYNSIDFSTPTEPTISKDLIINNFINIDNYNVISPIINEKYNTEDIKPSASPINFKLLFLEFKGNYTTNNAISNIVDIMFDEVIISNTGYKIWEHISPKTNDDYENINKRSEISVTKNNFENYIKTIISGLSPEIKSSDKRKEDEQAIFGTENEEIIKLNLYRTCKNIYDKWVGGVSKGDNVIFQCGDSKNKDNGEKTKLIDSFKFLNRSFRDIGDEFYVNPLPIKDDLKNNPNSSFYDVVGRLLASNNFDFIALPSFVNYNDETILNKMFDTVQVSDSFKEGICGPSFISVYVGQNSKNLEFSGSDYDNDGFDISCNNGSMNHNIPEDFKKNEVEDDNKVAVFSVDYGKTNQNIFKDVILDQSEFSETDESLLITDNISKNGSENNRSFIGQNIYNVYAVRSYKAEIEMMGNAMIQPMMYFQLNNIPMFHGAYMITHVKHSIKPNYMSTNFTGVRIKFSETDLLTASDVYMNLIDTISGTNSTAGKTLKTSKTNVVGSNEIYRPFVNEEVLENSGLKFQTPYLGGDNYAMKEISDFMRILAIKWYNTNKDKTNGDKIYVANFGALNGGTNQGHESNKSLHGIGLATDFRFVLNSKINKGNLTFSSPEYDFENTKKLLEMAIEQHKNGSTKINNIIFNDPNIINAFSDETNINGGKLVIQSPGHNNHIHIEFEKPERVLLAIKNNTIPDSVATTQPKGAKIKFTGKYPTNEDLINNLGKITG